jgi:glycosyltransferase involved in cell wall biosynthesis
MPETRVTFSVVTAAYQAAATIGAAVESVLRQTYPALEMIVSDDGSTDSIAEALEPFANDVTVVRNPHRGPGATRNAGLRVASGDFVVILDADDVYEPRRLEALADLVRRRPELDIATTDAFLERNGTVIGRFYNESFSFPEEEQRAEILRRCFLFAPAVRRERIEAIGGFDESAEVVPAEDWDCWIRLVLDGARAGLVDEPLVRYRLHAGSLTANRARSLRARVTVLEKTAMRSDITDDERRGVEASIVRRRRNAIVAEAAAAAVAGAPDVRARSLAMLLTNGVGARERLRAAAGVVSPRIVIRRARRRAT